MHATVCRLCLKELDLDDPDIRSTLDKAIQRAFNAVFMFDIRCAEGLPMHSCKQCSWNVLDFYCYSETVRKNQETLESKHLAKQENAQTFNGMELVKENTALNIMLTPTRGTTLTVEQLLACKAELDDVHVANELHPDLMDLSFENLDRCNTSITCEDYKITTGVYDNATQYAEAVPKEQTIPQESDDTGGSKKKVRNLLSSSVGRKLPKMKRKKTSDISSNELKAKRQTLNTDGGELTCPSCDQTFHHKKGLKQHLCNHVNGTCTICNKILRRRGIRRHMLSVHPEACSKPEKLTKKSTYTKQKKKSNTSAQTT